MREKEHSQHALMDISEYIIYCSNPDLIRSVKCSTFGYGFSKTNGKTVTRKKEIKPREGYKADRFLILLEILSELCLDSEVTSHSSGSQFSCCAGLIQWNFYWIQGNTNTSRHQAEIDISNFYHLSPDLRSGTRIRAWQSSFIY